MQAILKSNSKGFWFTVRNDNSLSGYGFYKYVNGFSVVNFSTDTEAKIELLKNFPACVISTAEEYDNETSRRDAVYTQALLDARAGNKGRLPTNWAAPFKMSS